MEGNLKSSGGYGAGGGGESKQYREYFRRLEEYKEKEGNYRKV